MKQSVCHGIHLRFWQAAHLQARRDAKHFVKNPCRSVQSRKLQKHFFTSFEGTEENKAALRFEWPMLAITHSGLRTLLPPFSMLLETLHLKFISSLTLGLGLERNEFNQHSERATVSALTLPARTPRSYAWCRVPKSQTDRLSCFLDQTHFALFRSIPSKAFCWR